MQEILFLAHRIPYPPDKGDKIRSWHILRHLTKTCKVHLGCFVDDAQDWQHTAFLTSLCDQTYFAPLSPFKAKIRSLKGLLTGAPLSVDYYADAAFDAWVDMITRTRPLAAIFVYSSAMGRFVLHRQKHNMPVVMDYVDVDSDKWAQYAKSRPWPMSWIYRRESRTLGRFERQLARAFSAGVFVSDHEAALFRSMAPESADKIHSLNNGVDFMHFSPELTMPAPFSGAAPRLVFTGAMDYWANVDAVEWFAREILPIIRHARPEVEFYIVGSKPAASVTALGELPGVFVTGRVEDVRPFLAHASVIVCPLRIARGIQNKVLEGMAMGRPVVATQAAFEGISAEPGKEIAVSDKPADFAREVIRLFDPEISREMGKLARQRIIRDYGWEQNLAILDRLMFGSDKIEVTASQPLCRIT